MVNVSVIMPAYKVEKTLLLAIKSTLRALDANSELLVQIDGPGDYAEILSQFADDRLRIFRNEEPAGITRALNFLLQEANGRYVARMDADDVSLRNRFKRQQRFLEENALDFAFANAVLFGRGIRPLGFIPQLPFSLHSDSAPAMLGFCNPFVHPTMFARRTSLLELGGYRLGVAAEDYDLWLRAALSNMKLGRSSSYGILYRVHKNQLSAQANIRSQWETSRNTNSLLNELLLGLGETESTPPEVTLSRLKREVAKRNRGYKFQYVYAKGFIDWARRNSIGAS